MSCNAAGNRSRRFPYFLGVCALLAAVTHVGYRDIVGVFTDLGADAHRPSMKNAATSLEEAAATTVGYNDNEGLRFCRADSDFFPARGGGVDADTDRLAIGYRCKGDAYETFHKQLHEFAWNESVARKQQQPFWGRRTSPFPGTGKKILVMGNSHTRQAITTFLCHYWHLVSSSIVYTQGVEAIHFSTLNSSLYIACNSPLVYSKEWQKLLEAQFSDNIANMTIASLDAIILGLFNNFGESANTKFRRDIDAFSESHPEIQIDFKKIPPPSFGDIARIYDGPIISLSGFAKSKDRRAEKSRSMITRLRNTKNRSNTRFIYGRTYVEKLERECGGDTADNLCHEPSDNMIGMKAAWNMHRCTGHHGGHPDLIAWDVAEELYSLLG